MTIARCPDLTFDARCDGCGKLVHFTDTSWAALYAALLKKHWTIVALDPVNDRYFCDTCPHKRGQT